MDGAVIEASDLNNEFDQILAAFAVSTGHTHDGTAAEGGPVTKLLGNTLTFGAGTAGTDITVTFDGETSDGVLYWMEDEDHFKFADDIVVDSTKRLYFNDEGGEYIYGDGTDLYLTSGADINIPANIGLTFMNIASIFPEGNGEVISLEDAFKGLEYDQKEIDYLIEKWTASAHYKDTVALMPLDPPKVLTGADYHPKGHHFNVKRCSRHLPSPTLTATGAGETGAGGCHWSEPRKFTIAELNRIMSLPDDFILTGKHSKKAERCGRMFPPLILTALADSFSTNFFATSIARLTSDPVARMIISGDPFVSMSI